LYKKTDLEGQEWYWSPNNEEYCKDFQSYEFDFIHDTTSGWKVRVWIAEKNQEILYFGGGDVSNPLDYYNCKLGWEYGGVYVREDITCSAVKEKMQE